MKNHIPMLCVLGLGVLLSQCMRQRTGDAKPMPANSVHQSYILHLASLDSAVARLDHLSAHSTGDSTATANLRRALLDARLAYKRVEFIAEYCAPLAARGVNGPPAGRTDADEANGRVIPPEGLQVLEGALFSDVLPSADTLTAQIAILRSNVRGLSRSAAATTLSDGTIFDAMRKEVIRVMAHGLSGFDAPLAQSSIPESAVALRAVAEGLQYYAGAIADRSPAFAARLDSLMCGAVDDLDARPDFMAFDRADFIRDRANPLYAAILQAARVLEISLPDDSRPLLPSAATIFSTAAFDPYAFAPGGVDRGTPERAALGRMLFFDPVLSGNGERSCASCHRPELAFTDGRPKSIAFGMKGNVARNAPTLINAALQGQLFYDRRVTSLEDQAAAVVANLAEMHGSPVAIVAKLRESPDYMRLFSAAFQHAPEQGITERNVRVALASYIRTLVGLNSPFDRFMRAEAPLEAGARRGFNLFMGKGRCGSCHFLPLFNGSTPPDFIESESEIVGIPTRYDTVGARLDPDLGRYAVDRIASDRYAFRTPTLRNIALTAPYMHNGAFRTLEEVIDFYNRGGGAGIGIPIAGQTLSSSPLGLTPEERGDLVTFLRALTDTTGTVGMPAVLPSIVGVVERKVGGSY